MMTIVKFLFAGLISATAMLTMANSVYAEETHVGESLYLNGGIGSEEADDIRAKASNYNLRLYLSEGKLGQSLADVPVSVTDKKGNVVLDLPDGGPMLFLRVDRGNYKVSGQHNGVTLTRKVTITNRRGENIYLNWKSTDPEDVSSQEP